MGKLKNRPQKRSGHVPIPDSDHEDHPPQTFVLKKGAPTERGKEALDDFSYGSSAKAQRSSQMTSTAKKVIKEDTGIDEEGRWSPTPYSAFKLVISARFAAALWSTISDCDETYNYWEPMHFLLYGKGFQTWEYSPEFALRSYTYILFHSVPASLYQWILRPNSLLIFFFVRCLLAFSSSASEIYLYRALRRNLGGNISRIALITSIFSAGMFISSTAFLPSAFSAYMTAFAFGAWLEKIYPLSIFCVALSALLSWPFAALTGAFIAFDILIIQRKFTTFLTWSLISLTVILLPVIGLDSYHYGKLVIPPLNIIKYNIFSPKGPDLYGTEPWTFYFINGFLNYNILFILAISSPIFAFFGGKIREKLVIIASFFLWLGVFIAQPHKEERFLFPIFPLIPICGAISLDGIQSILGFAARGLSRSKISILVTSFGVLAMVAASLIGCSRILALHYGYRAPYDIYFGLHREMADSEDPSHLVTSLENQTLCYGKEWHRFPTHFFLPKPSWNARFIRSEFRGQLPSLYGPPGLNGTRVLPPNMNDLNQEEPSRYVDISECDLLMDLVDSGGKVSPLEPDYSMDNKTWIIAAEEPYLNAGKSDRFYRAFYIPWMSPSHTIYDRYVLLRRRKPRVKKGINDLKNGQGHGPSRRKLGREFDDEQDIL